MTTKIEITITENDDVIFVYMYKEQSLIEKLQIPKTLIRAGRKTFMKSVCKRMGESLAGLIQSIIEGGE